MLDPTLNAASSGLPISPAKPKIVFKMITSDRMAGSVPAWIALDSPRDQSLAALSAKGSKTTFSDDLNHAMAYGPQQTESTADAENADTPFGFGDLVDIVNPLQHIPLVSNLYRAITGDHIRPSSDIIGGALYGGIVGAAGGLVNVIIKKETGKNVMEHAVAMIEGDHGTETSQPTSTAATDDKPLERLAKAQNNMSQELPGSVLSFVDLANHPVKPLPEKPERFAAVYKFNE